MRDPSEDLAAPRHYKEYRRNAIVCALIEAQTVQGAARLLGVSRSLVNYSITRMGIKSAEWKGQAFDKLEKFLSVDMQNGEYGIVTHDLSGKCEFKLVFKCRSAKQVKQTIVKLNQ